MSILTIIVLCYSCLLHFLNFAATTQQRFNKFAHLLLHHSTLTFYPSKLLYLVYMIQFSTLQPQIILLQILPIFCHTELHSLSTLCYMLHLTTPVIPSISANTSLYTLTCCYAICYNAHFYFPESLHFLFST